MAEDVAISVLAAREHGTTCMHTHTHILVFCFLNYYFFPYGLFKNTFMARSWERGVFGKNSLHKRRKAEGCV